MNEMNMIQEQWASQKASFVHLWNHASLQSDDAYIETLWDRITSGYCEAHRYYHSQRHILYCMKQLARVEDGLNDRSAVTLAIWFHDLVLDPSARDNEHKSMLLFQKLAENQLPDELVEKVSSLIMSTRHIDAPGNDDESFVQDIDISSMGADWDSFVRDVDDLKKEDAHLSEQQFIDGKRRFYHMMLDREKIYNSGYFFTHCEQTARANIRRYMNEML